MCKLLYKYLQHQFTQLIYVLLYSNIINQRMYHLNIFSLYFLTLLYLLNWRMFKFIISFLDRRAHTKMYKLIYLSFKLEDLYDYITKVCIEILYAQSNCLICKWKFYDQKCSQKLVNSSLLYLLWKLNKLLNTVHELPLK